MYCSRSQMRVIWLHAPQWCACGKSVLKTINIGWFSTYRRPEITGAETGVESAGEDNHYTHDNTAMENKGHFGQLRPRPRSDSLVYISNLVNKIINKCSSVHKEKCLQWSERCAKYCYNVWHICSYIPLRVFWICNPKLLASSSFFFRCWCIDTSRAHTHILSLSLSLSHTHTHKHTHTHTHTHFSALMTCEQNN